MKKVCKPKNKCENCGVTYYFKHFCDEESKWCTNCSTIVQYDHRYFIVKEELKKIKFNGFIFFDYESSQENGIHVPNLVIAHKYNQNMCLEEKKYFFDNGENVNNIFCQWLFKQKHFIAIAHNFKGYDGMFVMNYLLNNLTPGFKPPSILNQGNKILSLNYNNVKLIDSLLFLPMPLSEFSKTFDLKGYYVFYFYIVKDMACVIPSK